MENNKNDEINNQKKININIENDIIIQENEKEINHSENNINKQIIINIKENKNDEKNKIEENKEINNIIIKKDGISIINSQQLNKNFQKKNIIKKISIIDLDSKKEKKKERARFFSSEFSNISETSEKPKNYINKINNVNININNNKKKQKNKPMYKSPKNIINNNNNQINQMITPKTKNKHKLINRIRSINISSTKSLNFGHDFISKKLNSKEQQQNKRNNKLNHLSPINITTTEQKMNNNNHVVNKKYSENNLIKIWPKFFNNKEYDLSSEFNEFNENEEIYYYEPKHQPQSIVNYSLLNFTNKKKNKKILSYSYQKENNKSQSKLNNILNDTINTINRLFSSKKEENKENKEKKEKKDIDVNKLKENIEIKNKEIEKIKKLIKKAEKEMEKCDNEIRNIDNWIQKEENKNENMIYFFNYININNNNII